MSGKHSTADSWGRKTDVDGDVVNMSGDLNDTNPGAGTKRFGVVVGIAVLLLTLTGCDVSQGGGCNQVGSQHTNKDGTKFECIRNVDTGRGFWRANP